MQTSWGADPGEGSEAVADHLTPKRIKQLVDLVASIIRETTPECLRNEVKITNRSSRQKFHIRVDVPDRCIVVIQTVATRLEIAAGGSLTSCIGHRWGTLLVDEITEYVTKVLKDRFADAEQHYLLNQPLRKTPGVVAYHAGGLDDPDNITLTFQGLSQAAYERMLPVLVPLMHKSRFDRKAPV